jgi:crotonobetainyl-CoA:carnitine CoA-transferase CaiB-like acyl-CoA transferase
MMPRPLRGRTVVDLSQYIAGAVCGQVLADWGADVIKIEPPGGDPSRGFRATEHGSIYFRSYNTGKRSETLDLATSVGQDRVEDLLGSCDAVVVNFSRRTLHRLGLDWPRLSARHPHVTMAAVTGYGLDDDRTCFDAVAQCESGYARLNAWTDGTPHVAAGYPSDVLAGTHAGMVAAMALCGGADRGVLIDVSLVEVAATVLCGAHGVEALETGSTPTGQGNRDRAVAPAGVYACTDGHCFIYGGVDHHWQRLAPLVGGPTSWSPSERLERSSELDDLVGRWTATRTVEEVCTTLEPLGVPAGPVRDLPEAVGHLQERRRDAVASRRDGGQAVPTFPALIDGQRLVRTPAPRLAEVRP